MATKYDGMSWTWYAEYDPYHMTRQDSPAPDGETTAWALYQQYQDGQKKLGPSGEAARCGYFRGQSHGAGFNASGYTCSVSAPQASTITGGVFPTIAPPTATPGSSWWSRMSTGSKVVGGIAIVGLGYLLLKKGR